MKYNIPFIKPHLPSPEILAEDYREIVASNWYTNFGPFEQRLRQSTGEYIGNNVHICTASNATIALSVATRVLFDKHEGRKNVLVPSFTFAAGPEALIANGYTPVFIDIDENIQPSLPQARDYLTRNAESTAGILLCNTFGVGNADIEKWEVLAREIGLPLIIDSAAGFGSEYPDGSKVGTRGDCEIFSLHATKPFSVGEGGLIASQHQEFIDRCRAMTNFGFGPDRHIDYIGTNAKLQELNCAIGLRQLEYLDIRLNSRRNTLRRYKQALGSLGYGFQDNDEKSTVAFASIIAPSDEIAIHLHRTLNESGIEARRYYSPLHYQSILAKHCIQICGLNKTEEIASRVVSLPVHDNMEENDIDSVINLSSREKN